MISFIICSFNYDIDEIKEDKMDERTAHRWDEKYIQILVRNPERKRPVERQRCSWKDSIKIESCHWESSAS
jgi:hypothetical protein